jgi:hypothetical protein
MARPILIIGKYFVEKTGKINICFMVLIVISAHLLRYIIIKGKNRIVMKKITLIIAAMLYGITTSAQLQTESFNNNTLPAGWTSINESSGCNMQFGYTGAMPESGDPTATFTTGAAFFDDSVCGTLSKDRIVLTAPTIDLTGVTNAEMVVIYNLQVFGSKGEFIIEAFNGIDWVQILMQDSDTPRNTGANQTKILDVSEYLNDAFAIRFIYDDEGSRAWGVGIDNYTLTNNTVAGIEEFADIDFKYYPNPVANFLKLNSKENIEEINIYNILGQEVLHKNISARSAQIDLSNLPVGAYIAHVQIDSRVGTIKILKQ